MIMNGKYVRNWKEAVVAYFKLLYRLSPMEILSFIATSVSSTRRTCMAECFEKVTV